MNIALFGTSADPPTAAHQTILQWLADHYDLVAIWAADNPFKCHQTSLIHRMAMLERLISTITQTNLQVCPELSDRRSLMSVEKAKQIWGETATYHLVIGSDLVSQIPQWYQVKILLSSVKLIIFCRFGYPFIPQELATLTQLGGNYTIADIEIPAVSSTGYRVNKDKTILLKPVKDYISQQKLYI
ncbi:MAG: nicotinate-nucleotide adenylyltransferase [Microcystaceae cyanobacterium]